MEKVNPYSGKELEDHNSQNVKCQWFGVLGLCSTMHYRLRASHPSGGVGAALIAEWLSYFDCFCLGALQKVFGIDVQLFKV